MSVLIKDLSPDVCGFVSASTVDVDLDNGKEEAEAEEVDIAIKGWGSCCLEPGGENELDEFGLLCAAEAGLGGLPLNNGLYLGVIILGPAPFRERSGGGGWWVEGGGGRLGRVMGNGLGNRV